MNISERFRVEWDALFAFQVGAKVMTPAGGEPRTILERGLRETTDGFRKQYRFLFNERFDWVDESQLLLFGKKE